MTESLMNALLSVQPDATIKDYYDFFYYLSDEQTEFAEKELKIKEKAIQAIRKLSQVQIR